VRVRGGIEKWIVKHAFAPLLPAGIPWRRKQGFSVPIDRWLAGPLAETLRETVVEDGRGIARFAEPGRVRALFDEHVSGRRKHGGRLWALLSYELWFRECAAARQAPRPVPV
jgi:asparagine synthase (glutamine-hydrolysing)